MGISTSFSNAYDSVVESPAKIAKGFTDGTFIPLINTTGGQVVNITRGVGDVVEQDVGAIGKAVYINNPFVGIQGLAFTIVMALIIMSGFSRRR